MPDISKWNFFNSDNNGDLFSDDCLSLINSQKNNK